MNANNNKMKMFTNIKALYELINRSKLKNTEIYVWRFVAGEKLVAKVKVKVIRKYRDEIVLTPSFATFEEFEKLISGTEHINFFLPNDGVLFQSKIKGYELNKALTVSTPDKYVQLDRRQYIRLNIKDAEEVKVSMLIKQNGIEKKFTKDCFDISAGGFSVLFNKNETKSFYKDLSIKKIVLLLEGKHYSVPSQVVNNIELDPKLYVDIIYKTNKVSFKFQNVNEELKEIINQYVFDNIDPEEIASIKAI